MNRTTTFALIASALTATLALTGCAYSPGGSGSSTDGPFTYVSTTHLPQTVAVIDTRTTEQLLVVEVPVGKQLVLSFYNKDDEIDGKGTLRWGVMPAGQSYGGLTNNMEVPPASARRVDVSFRRSPEYTKPLVAVKSADLPQGVTIKDATKPTTAKPAPAGTKPVEVEVTSPKAPTTPKVDIPD